MIIHLLVVNGTVVGTFKEHSLASRVSEIVFKSLAAAGTMGASIEIKDVTLISKEDPE